jgi:AcrR family transcriptional regulator
MGTKECQELERGAIRDAILAAARELFLAEGDRLVSMRKIAERIQYSPAAIYSCFASKDGIFFTLAEEGYHLLADGCNAALAGAHDPLDALRSALWAFYEFSKAFPEYFESIFLGRSVARLSQDASNGSSSFSTRQHARKQQSVR